MSVFREKINETPVEAPIEKKETPDKIEKTDGATPLIENEPKKLEIYETEKGHKFAEKYFNVRNIVAEDRIMRMNIGQIDKHIKNLIEEKGMEKTIDNYAHLIHLIESEIGSERLETYKRIQKIIGYIKVLNKLNKIKELKEKYVLKNNI